MCEPFTLAGWGPPTVQDADAIGNNAEGVGERFLSSQPSDCPGVPPELECLSLYLAGCSWLRTGNVGALHPTLTAGVEAKLEEADFAFGFQTVRLGG